LLRRKIMGRCVRSSVSSAAGSYGRRRKVSITIRLRRHATSGAGERESRSEKSSGEYQEILREEAATPHTARSGGISGMHHQTTVRDVDHIGGTVSAGLGGWTARERAAPTSRFARNIRVRWRVPLPLHFFGIRVTPQRMLDAVFNCMKCEANSVGQLAVPAIDLNCV
jgi:hypothetical protein